MCIKLRERDRELSVCINFWGRIVIVLSVLLVAVLLTGLLLVYFYVLAPRKGVW